MTTLRHQVSLLSDSPLPRDIAMNTWHFQSNSVDPLVDAADIFGELNNFYDSIDGFLSSGLSGDAVCKVYDLSEPTPRFPILTQDFGITPGTGERLPSEVAVCLSFAGATFSGDVPARRRGRIYLGPIDSGVTDAAVGDTFVDGGAAGTIASAAQTLMDAGSEATWLWAVFSPTTAGPEPWTVGELLAATFPVVRGYVDNAFDTVRSRGLDATARTSFP